MLPPKPACKFLADIDATRCIGCNFCRQACPFDAITGAPGYLYFVIEPYCTGCRDCVAPCPIDCISIVTNPSFEECTHTQRKEFANAAKQRAHNLVERRKHKDMAQRTEFDDLKRQAQHQAASTLATLKLKLGSGQRSVQNDRKRD